MNRAGRFADQVVLITGSSRGIGRSVAARFAEEGAAVIVNHIGDDTGAKEIERELRLRGATVCTIEADVTNLAKVEAMVADIALDIGPITVLVNNAGVVSHIPFAELSADEWWRVITINLGGVFNCCRAIVPKMVQQRRGKIINIASRVGLVGAANLSHYSASKGGVIAFSKSLAQELAPHNINVNVVAPGPIETQMLWSNPQEYDEELLRSIPIGRWGRPEEVAATVAFLASEDASFYVGGVFSPNGGISM